MNQADLTRSIIRAEQLTRDYPPGTPCSFWPGAKEGPGLASVIRSPFVVAMSGDVVVFVAGHPAYVAATHVEPRQHLCAQQ